MHSRRITAALAPFVFASLAACSGVATGTGAEGGNNGNGNLGGSTPGTSSGATDGTVNDNPPPSKKRAFVTSQAYDGALTSAIPSAANGLEAADALCQVAADAAVLGGKFKAYLGAGTTTADSRIAEVGPWYLVDKSGAGQKVFNNKSNFMTQPLVEFSNDERGETIDASDGWAWTGGNGLDCEGWTRMRSDFEGTGGFTRAKTGQWRDVGGGGVPCNRKVHLYCFEQ